MGKDPETGKRRQRRISGFPTKREAEAELARILSERETIGLTPDSRKMTVKDFMVKWLAVHKHAVEFTTAAGYERVVRLHIIYITRLLM